MRYKSTEIEIQSLVSWPIDFRHHRDPRQQIQVNTVAVPVRIFNTVWKAHIGGRDFFGR